ncbi:MAG TPA: glycosyltransferase family 39 protein [Chloroflexota bacterium]|nr:glycosyltransferase family 39 protein [Chloroflexota bacterium]
MAKVDNFRRLAWPRDFLVILIFLAFTARVWKIGVQSLWFDEALSAIFAAQPVRQLLPTLVYQDLHPPLYYLLLHFWMRLVGNSEFAIRYLSLLCGLPAVPATYIFGRALFHSTVGRESEASGPKSPISSRAAIVIGLIGAFLLAFSPFMVYYSQEARMYALLATMSLFSSHALWKLLTSRQPRWWWAYVIFTTAMLYSQYFGGLVVVFQCLVVFSLLLRGNPVARKAIGAMVLVGLLYVPWLPFAYLQIERMIKVPDFWKGELSFTYVLGHIFGAFALGQFAALGNLVAAAVVIGCLLGIGILLMVRQALRHGQGEFYLLAYLLLPFLGLYALLVQNPKFTERYLIMIVPAFYLALGYGLVVLADRTRYARLSVIRWSGMLASTVIFLALVGATFSQLWQVYYGPGYRKDDNRGAIDYIEQHYQPGDVVLLMMDTRQAFEYYSHGNIPWVAIQPGTNVQAGAAMLNRALTGRKRAWLLLWNPDWADPTGYVRQALDNAYPRLPVNGGFAGLELRLYAIDGKPDFTVRTTPSIPELVNFGNRLQLLGYDLPTQTIQSGQSGQVTLYWKAITALQRDYIVSLRITDGTFYWWRHDGRPAAETYPTTSWTIGQVVSGKLSFQVPPGTPPGTYDLELGVYGQGVGADLNVLRGGVPIGTAIKFAKITVLPAATNIDPTQVALPGPRNVDFQSLLRLVGVEIDDTQVRPGSQVDLGLWWLPITQRPTDFHVQVQLQNGSFQRTVLDALPNRGRYPPNEWHAGELVGERERFIVPVDVPPGPTRVLVAVLPDGQSQPVPTPQGVSTDVGTINVIGRQIVTTPPASVAHSLNVTLGSFANLIGYDLSNPTPQPGDHLRLTLYWRAKGNSGETAYTVFAHALDSRNQIVAQQDHPPGNGNDPTTGWVEGEYVTDYYDLALPSNLAPGMYSIEVGMYNPSTGQRLPVQDADGKVTGDRIVLGTIQVQ